MTAPVDVLTVAGGSARARQALALADLYEVEGGHSVVVQMLRDFAALIQPSISPRGQAVDVLAVMDSVTQVCGGDDEGQFSIADIDEARATVARLIKAATALKLKYVGGSLADAVHESREAHAAVAELIRVLTEKAEADADRIPGGQLRTIGMDLRSMRLEKELTAALARVTGGASAPARDMQAEYQGANDGR